MLHVYVHGEAPSSKFSDISMYDRVTINIRKGKKKEKKKKNKKVSFRGLRVRINRRWNRSVQIISLRKWEESREEGTNWERRGI